MAKAKTRQIKNRIGVSDTIGDTRPQRKSVGKPGRFSSKSVNTKNTNGNTRRGNKSTFEESPKQAGSGSKKHSPNKKTEQSVGNSGIAKAVGARKEPKILQKKTMKLAANKSRTRTEQNLAIEVDLGGHSPRKKRLRSFDKPAQSVETGLAKPSPAKKFKGSTGSDSKAKKLANNESSNSSEKGLTKKSSKTGSGNAGGCLADQIRQKRSGPVKGQSEKQRQEVNSARSSPRSLYDFTADSPKILDSISSTDKTEEHQTTLPKSVKTAPVKKVVGKKTRLRNEVDPSLITPKTKRCKVILSPVDQNKRVTKKITVKAVVHVQDGRKNVPVNMAKNKGNGKIKANVQKGKKTKTKDVRTAIKSQDLPIPKMPSISFLDNEISSEPYEDDSAIFLSPKRVVPRINKLKAEEARETPILSGNIKDKRLRSIDCSFNVQNIKSTSTPNPEPKTDGDPIREQVSGGPKLAPPVFSPVKQVETPATSDYESMVVTPSPNKDDHEREHSPSPAFSLDDDTDTINLNKSTDKFYKRSKKKFQKSRYSVSKMDEWAEKMNSEIQDIENFELSVEG